MRLFKPTTAERGCTGKCTLFVPEKLGLHQILGDGRRVDRDERFAGAGAMFMQGARNQLLTGTGLARDHHRDLRTRQPSDGAKHLLHGRRLTHDDGIALLGIQAVFLRITCNAGRALHQLDGIINVKGLGQVLECPLAIRRHGAVQVRMRGHDDDGQIRRLCLDPLQQLQAIDTRHADVGEQHVRHVALQLIQHLHTAREALDVHVMRAQCALQHPAN